MQALWLATKMSLMCLPLAVAQCAGSGGWSVFGCTCSACCCDAVKDFRLHALGLFGWPAIHVCTTVCCYRCHVNRC